MPALSFGSSIVFIFSCRRLKKNPMAMVGRLSGNSRQGIKVQKPTCLGLERDLSRNLRWGCGHVYDETPVDIAVYVRNDPVNLVDPDGRFVINVIYHPTPPGLSPFGELTLGIIFEELTAQKNLLLAKAYARDFGEPALSPFDKRVINQQAKTLKKLEKPGKDCEGLFKVLGISSSQVRGQLGDMNFVDGTTSQDLIQDVLGQAYANATGTAGWTVSDLFKYGFPPLPTNKVVNGWSPPNGANTAYLRPGTVTWGLEIHETLHQFTNLDDGFIMKTWGLNSNGPSSQITDKIMEECN